MKYFEPPYTASNINKQFKKLCFQLHPDKNGNAGEFIKMKTEKENLIKAVEKFPAVVKPKKKKKVVKTVPIRYVKYFHVYIDANELINNFIRDIM